MTDPKKPETTRPIPALKPGDPREVTRPTAVTKASLTRPPTISGLSGRMDLRKIAEPQQMTPGMLKHRKYVEKMKRKAAAEKLSSEADRIEKWSRQQKVVLLVLAVALAGLGYYKVQSVYHDKWPLFTVWMVMVVALLSCFAWILWYIDKGDM